MAWWFTIHRELRFALAAAAVRLEYPEEGGHVGFVTGSFPGHLGWLPIRLARFFESGA